MLLPTIRQLVNLTSITMTSIPMTATEMRPTSLPSHTDSSVIGIVIVLVLLTLAGLGFLLYRYLCHNKGAYRTTGEPAPGEDCDLAHSDIVTDEKKEYFI
ncbi:small cell adhesion glycoprotein-like [Salvelinus sp. IW2-2015]|uniref:small cell adhesion glycoprotein-like n=1 Tax=Salvelinus sp. IW2-2015 TaxID=2691554 RepID=UPI0038D3E033